MKKILSVCVVAAILGTSQMASAAILQCPTCVHEPTFSAPYDISGAIARALQAAVKYFISDDDEIVAELVYKGSCGGGGSKKEEGDGGLGGAYTGDNGSIPLDELKALTSSITDIPAEKGAYPADIKVQNTSIEELAEYRIKTAVQEQASLDELSAEKWAIQYRAQQRAIQAMTDALMMKKVYKDLAAIGEKASEGGFANYSKAASTVATRRLLLGELMALRKRVIAARIRARAEAMEMDLETVTTAPGLEGGN